MSWVTEIDNCITTSEKRIQHAEETTATHKPKFKNRIQQQIIKRNKPVKQTIKNIDYKNKTALVQSKKGKIYPVILSDRTLAKNVTETDIAIVKKINGHWIMIDVEKPAIKTESESSTAQLFEEDFEWSLY